MTILQKLAFRQLRLNKRRTLVTILGVMIASAMLTATVSGIFSGLEYIRENKIAQEGEWHVRYTRLAANKVPTLSTGEGDKVFTTSDLGYAKLEKPRLRQRPYLLVSSLDGNAFTALPLKVTEGRLPVSSNELALSTELCRGMDRPPKVGDTVTYALGKRVTKEDREGLGYSSPLKTDPDGVAENLEGLQQKTYRVVGYFDPPAWHFSTGPSYFAVTHMEARELPPSQTVQAYVIKKDLSAAVYKEAGDNAKALDCGYETNSILLASYLVGNDVVLAFSALCLLIFGMILIAGVSLISNAFAVTAAERTRQLGMLASFGATRKQKFQLLMTEGLFIGAVGIPAGISAGILGLWAAFEFINRRLVTDGTLLGMDTPLRLIVSPLSLLLCAALGIVTIVISVLRPALSASRVSPIEAILQTKSVCMKSKALRTPKWIQKLFGIEAALAVKNLKRNGWRFRATLFSMILSIVLFLGVFGFTTYSSDMIRSTLDNVPYDIQVNYHNLDEPFQQEEEIIQELDRLEPDLLAVPSAEKVWAQRTANVLCTLPGSSFSPEYRKFSHAEGGSGNFYTRLVLISKEEMAEKRKLAGLPEPDATKYDGVPSLLVNYFENQEGAKSGDEAANTIVTMQKGEALSPTVSRIQNGDTNKYTAGEPLRIIGIVEEPASESKLYVSREDVSRLDPALQQSLSLQRGYYYKTRDAGKTQEELLTILEGSSLSPALRNYANETRQDEQMIAIVTLFTIGFITLITLISLANLFNMISTSISLRRKEFAMLKSMGITPRSFRRMIRLESLIYAVVSLLWGMPVGITLNLIVYRIAVKGSEFPFYLPWAAYLGTMAAVCLLILGMMAFSVRKVTKEPVMEALRDDVE